MIKNLFPNFLAGIITDHHGFPISTHITNKIKMKENELALQAISNRFSLSDDLSITKIKVNLDKTKNIKLLLLIETPNNYILGLSNLRKMIKSQVLF